MDQVHVDDKLFHPHPTKKTYYLLEDDNLPTLKAKSKRYVKKMMFCSALAQPRYDYHHKQYFNGLLGCWAFVEHGFAKRKSVNRPAGAPVINPVTSVNKQVAIPRYVNQEPTPSYPGKMALEKGQEW